MNYLQRITNLRKRLKRSKADAVLISTPINVVYLTGFESSNSMVLVTRDAIFLVTDFRYQALAESVAERRGVGLHIADRNLNPGIAKFCAKLGLATVAFEENNMTFARVRELQKHAKKVSWFPSADWTEKLRRIKEPAEVDAMMVSIKVAEKAYRTLRKKELLGLTEFEAADLLMIRVKESAARMGLHAHPSFTAIVAVGPNAFEPHHHVNETIITNNQMVKIDFGVSINNYCSDITRMLYFGRLTQKFKKIYSIVLKAQMNAIKKTKPGMRMCDIDMLARSVIDKAGYGEYFGHGLGHGLGMAGAELYGARPGDTTVAEPGMTFTIEPGIYIHGWGGIRIEDDILVTEDGIKVLTSLPK
jgi:Xaa-Pro aminopeptidase